jgi:MYXO-CTERM domain-containing protein
MARRSSIVAAFLASLAVFSVAPSAFADAAAPSAGRAAPGCNVSLLGGGTTLPSNAPAIILNDSSHGGAEATVTAELVAGTERTALVGPALDTHGIMVLRLSNPPVGAHSISTNVACSVALPGVEKEKTFETPITFTAPVAFPKTVGTLTVVPSNPPTGTSEIVLQASTELAAFLPISVMKLTVNEEPGTKTAPQSGTSAMNFIAHTGAVCIENGTLHREKRTVKVTVSADIAGLADSPAPAIADVEVDCGAIKWTTERDYQFGKDSTSSGTATGDPNSASSTNHASGCTAAPSGRASGTAGVVIAAALGMLAGLRRRRR